MSDRSVVSSSLDGVRRVFRTGPLATVVSRLGVEAALSDGYWALQYRLADGTVTQQIGSSAVDFAAEAVDEFRHYRTLVDEQAVVADLLDTVQPTDIFWDVGAYIGAYTCLVADAVDTAPVAFEPRDPWADRIVANLDENNLDGLVVRRALADTHREVELAVDDVARLDITGRAHRVAATDAGLPDADAATIADATNAESTADQSVNHRTVETVSGDALVARGTVPAPNVIKIDVEGAELAVLDGLETVLSMGSCRLVYCEVHPDLLAQVDASPADVRERLVDHGFTVTRVHDRGSEFFLRAER